MKSWKKLLALGVTCSSLLFAHAEAAYQLSDEVENPPAALQMLIENAIKFTPEGKGIEVYYKRDGDFARICVQDHGVRIAADRIDTIFHKGETTYGTGGEEGSGLGLQLCQDFARKNGGDAYVESVEGEGSTFSFTIPLKKEEA